MIKLKTTNICCSTSYIQVLSQSYLDPRLTKGEGVVATPPYGFSPVALKH